MVKTDDIPCGLERRSTRGVMPTVIRRVILSVVRFADENAVALYSTGQHRIGFVVECV